MLSSEALELGSEASEPGSGAAVLVSTFVSAHRCRVTGDAICKRSEFWGLGVEFKNLRAEF